MKCVTTGIMRVQILGKNSIDAIKRLNDQQLIKQKLFIQNTVPTDLSFADNFCRQLSKFFTICTQVYIPGFINIYGESPWSYISSQELNVDQKLVLQQYQSVMGWAPDYVIYLFDPLDSVAEWLERLIDPDVTLPKIYKLNANEPLLTENLTIIIDDIIKSNSHRLL